MQNVPGKLIDHFSLWVSLALPLQGVYLSHPTCDYIAAGDCTYPALQAIFSLPFLVGVWLRLQLASVASKLMFEPVELGSWLAR